MSQDSKPLTRPFPTVPIFISFRKLGRHDAIEWPDLIKTGQSILWISEGILIRTRLLRAHYSDQLMTPQD